jgi:hypothetical protein
MVAILHEVSFHRALTEIADQNTNTHANVKSSQPDKALFLRSSVPRLTGQSSSTSN